MEDRRRFLLALGALAAAPRLFEPVRTAGVIALPPPFNNLTATIVEVYCAPGQRSTAHKHPGFVLGYVLEGTFRSGTHLVAESTITSRPARILAIVIAETGQPIVQPA